jgi:hypothetical protein
MSGGQNVIADPQFSIATVLRPFTDFEDVYAGQSALRPVRFFPPGADGAPAPYDQQVGNPNIDANLMRYLPVPLGSRILVYIPHAITWQESIPAPIIETNYTYTIHWRIRNLDNARSSMNSEGKPKPYHSQTFAGRPDTTAPAGTQNRLVIPAATRSVLIEQPIAAGSFEQVQQLRRERVQLTTTYLDSTARPFMPDGTDGVDMQGVIDPGAMLNFEFIARSSLFMPFEFRCEGDEMSIEANRYDAWGGAPDNWAFEGLNAPDAPFSNVYGRNLIGPAQPALPGLGIYVFQGA